MKWSPRVAAFAAFPLFSVLSLGLFPQNSLAGTYSDAVLADSPVAYYRLDETSGTTAENLGTAGAAIDGTYVNIPGGTATNTSNYGVPGPRTLGHPGFEADNNSIFLDPEDGSGDTDDTFPRVEVGVPDDSGTSPLAITGAMTMEAWIKRGFTASGTNEGIVGRYRQSQNGGARSYVMYYEESTDGSNGNPDGTPGIGVAFSTSATGGFQSANSYEFAADIPKGQWTHVAAVLDPGNSISVYVNGELAGEVTSGVLTDPLYSGEGDFWIGQQFNGNDAWTFQGGIDEVAIYNTALSAQQIANHYAAAVPEPGTLLLAASVLGLAFASRKLRGSR